MAPAWRGSGSGHARTRRSGLPYHPARAGGALGGGRRSAPCRRDRVPMHHAGSAKGTDRSSTVDRSASRVKIPWTWRRRSKPTRIRRRRAPKGRHRARVSTGSRRRGAPKMRHRSGAPNRRRRRHPRNRCRSPHPPNRRHRRSARKTCDGRQTTPEPSSPWSRRFQIPRCGTSAQQRSSSDTSRRSNASRRCGRTPPLLPTTRVGPFVSWPNGWASVLPGYTNSSRTQRPVPRRCRSSWARNRVAVSQQMAPERLGGDWRPRGPQRILARGGCDALGARVSRTRQPLIGRSREHPEYLGHPPLVDQARGGAGVPRCPTRRTAAVLSGRGPLFLRLSRGERPACPGGKDAWSSGVEGNRTGSSTSR